MPGNGKANGKRYSEEFKAAVVADLLSGLSERAVARKHRVDRQSVVRWALESRHVVRPEKLASIDERQERIVHKLYDLVEAIADAASDQEYLRSQPAGDLAVLVGVSADKAERVTVLRVRLAERTAEFAALAERNPKVVDVSTVSR